MFGKYFYNEGLRKCTIAFGAIFNNIQLQRTNSSGEVVQSIKVPLAYAPKEKFLVRLEQQASLDDREFAITLPRMGFEIKSLRYDATRKLTRLQKHKSVKNSISGKVLDYNYTPVPYNIGFDLSIFTATAESGLQIVEQILPFFQPDYTVTINVVPELDMKRDVPIILDGVTFSDNYDASFTNRRAVIYTLSFTAKTYLYGPSTTQKVIKTVQSDIYTDTDVTSAREERIVVVPNPTSADADDDFGFTTTISNFADGKRYDKVRDEDV
jgi:hypothetical protein